MFTKKTNSSEITIASENKYRYLSVTTNEQYIKIKQKVDKRPHLNFDYEVRSYETGEGGVFKLSTKKYKTKAKPYDIKGKTLLLERSWDGIEFHEVQTQRTDSFFLPEYQELNDYISTFSQSKDFYKKENLIYKSGIVLYGHPGNGKSSWIRYIMNNKILPEDTTFIWCNILPPQSFIDEFKKIDCLKVFIFEEITSNLNNSQEVKQFLTFMDGEQSLDNAIFIATTNNPEQLPQNVIERPGRFDLIVEIDNPKEKSREVILKHYFKEDYSEDMIQTSKGLSHAEIMYAFILAKKHQVGFSSAVKKLKDHKEFVKRGFEKYKKIGFGDD